MKMVDELSDDDVLVVVDHPHGRIEVPLKEWKRVGPGPRPFLTPLAAIRREPRATLPLSVIPLRYRNTRLSRLLIRLGVLTNPWK
jgi:hypothetical protein